MLIQLYLKHNDVPGPDTAACPQTSVNVWSGEKLLVLCRPVTDKVHREAISGAVSFINEHYAQPLTIAEIAAFVYMSTYHFCRIFKKHTTHAPHQYLLQVRLERAAFLLGNSDKTITEICYLCGFKRASHFSVMFTKKYLVSPTTFRVQAQDRLEVSSCRATA